MKLAHSVKVGAWLLIALNLLMAFSSIWIFMRMAPAIEVIISQNEVSLEASEEMLAALLQVKTSDSRPVESTESFRNALTRAKNNITEKEEPAVIDKITRYYEGAFKGNNIALKETVRAIVELGVINRDAMRRADAKARQLGYAGAWGVVFMATVIFMVGMIFIRSMKKNILEPMQEIDAVINAFREGNMMRRCSMKSPPKSIRHIFGNINDLLDMRCSAGIAGGPQVKK